MSIAKQLQQCTSRLRILLRRNNGDILEAGPAVLDELDDVLKRVRGLENAACPPGTGGPERGLGPRGPKRNAGPPA